MSEGRVGEITLMALLVATLIGLVIAVQALESRQMQDRVREGCGEQAPRILSDYESWQDDLFKPRARVIACGPHAEIEPREVKMFYDQQRETENLCARGGHLVDKDARGGKTPTTYAIIKCH